MKRTVMVLLALLANGCSMEKVHPWEREDLARPEMSAEPDFLESAMRDHTYVSKEAASGGSALAGGGCGCN